MQKSQRSAGAVAKVKLRALPVVPRINIFLQADVLFFGGPAIASSVKNVRFVIVTARSHIDSLNRADRRAAHRARRGGRRGDNHTARSTHTNVVARPDNHVLDRVKANRALKLAGDRVRVDRWLGMLCGRFLGFKFGPRRLLPPRSFSFIDRVPCPSVLACTPHSYLLECNHRNISVCPPAIRNTRSHAGHTGFQCSRTHGSLFA